MAADDTITLELLGARLLALTADVRDLQQRFAGMEMRLGALETRFSGLEARFTGLEGRFAVQEERMTRLIALVVRIAERVGTSAD
ncbi:MAG: hypothetical protein AB7T18_02440 [Alphaproteobacteria bacterium]